MSDANNPYLLPRRKALKRGDDSFEPKRFKRLVEGLPLGDVGQLSKSIHTLLTQMNGLELSVASRISNLEALRGSLQFVLAALGKGFVRQMPPLGKRAAMMAETREMLCILAVQAYKVVLDQYHHASVAGQLLHKSNRALALHRVLYFLGQNLLQSYQLYRPAPRFIWREIHGIHRYAVDQKLDRRLVESEEPELVPQSCISDLYKQILLLSLAGPQRLMQGEVSHVYAALAQWAPKAQLNDLGRSHGDDGSFLVDIGVDEPPRMKGAERDHQVLKGWLLDTRELAIQLASELEQTEALHGVMRPREKPDRLSPDLMARLMLTWGIGAKRVSERDETSGEVSLICGLEAIYATAGGELLPKTTASPGAFTTTEKSRHSGRQKSEGVAQGSLEADEFVINDDPQLVRIRDSIQQSNDPSTRSIFLDAPPPPREDPMPADVVRPVLRTCPLFNESSSGYHLGWTAGREQQISVGELVAVTSRDPGEKGLLRLGVIRWIRAERPELIDFGVELFSGDIMPVIFTRQWGRHRQQGVWPGLLLQRPNEDPTLITSPFYTEPTDKTWLTQQGEKRQVMLSREIEATASFIQFYCWDPDQDRRDRAAGDEFTEADFEQLWSHL